MTAAQIEHTVLRVKGLFISLPQWQGNPHSSCIVLQAGRFTLKQVLCCFGPIHQSLGCFDVRYAALITAAL